MKIEELLKDSTETVAIVSGEYAEDEKALAENPVFQRIALEIPPGYDMGDWSVHSFTLALNKQARSKGLDFKFIGTPRKAMARIWEACGRL